MFLVSRVNFLLPHVVIWILVLFTCFSTGFGLLSKIKKENAGLLYSITALLFGYISLSYYYYLIGMLKLYREPFISIFPIMIACAFSVSTWRKSLNIGKEISQHKSQFLIVCLVFSGLVLLLVFPDIGFDSNWFHLSQPYYYLKSGGIYHIGGYIFPSGYPQFTEMLFTPLLKWGDSTTTSLFSVFNFLVLALAVYSLTKIFTFKKRYAVLFAVTVLTTPVIFTYAGLAYVDILQGVYLLMAFYWVTNFIRTFESKSLLIGALLLIPVCTIKYSGALICIPIAGYLVVSRTNLITKVKALAILSLIPILGLIPWLVRNKLETNNPFDPMGTVKMLHYGSDAPDYLTYLKTIKWSTTLTSMRTENHLDFLLPLAIVTISIYFIVCKKWPDLVFTLLSLVVYRSMPPGDHYRYFIPFIPIILIYFFYVLYEVKRRYIRVSLFSVLAIFITIQIYIVVSHLIPISYALGIKDTKDFKNYYFVKEPYMVYDTSERLKNEVGDQKLIVKGVDLIYPTITEFNAQDYSYADLNKHKIYTFKTLRQEMQENGYKYILVNRGNLQSHFALWFTETETDKVDQYFDLLIHEVTPFGKEWFLYKTKEDPRGTLY